MSVFAHADLHSGSRVFIFLLLSLAFAICCSDSCGKVLIPFPSNALLPVLHESIIHVPSRVSASASASVSRSLQSFRLTPSPFFIRTNSWISSDTSLQQIQFDLSLLLAFSPLLEEHFAGFLFAPLKSRAQERAARRYLCTLTGLPGTSKM
jgi:hypothetical protein